MNFLWYIIIGIVAGFLAGKIMHGGGFGLIVNLIVGIIGGLLGGCARSRHRDAVGCSAFSASLPSGL